MSWTSLIINTVPWDTKNDSRSIANAQEIWNFFRYNGFTEEATAGIIGNMAQESFLNPGQIGLGYSITDPYTPRGLIMWTTQTNIDRLYSFVGQNNWSNGYSQCDYIYNNPNQWVFSPNSSQGYTYTWQEFSELTDLQEATYSFCWQAERPGVPALERRYDFADYFYQMFTGHPPTPPTPTPTITHKGMPIYMMLRKLF